MHEMILCKLGEVVLKGLNRRSFEDKLMSNVNRRVSKCGNFRVYSKQSTIYVEPKDDECDIEAAFESCKKIFGIIAVSKALPCGFLSLGADYEPNGKTENTTYDSDGMLPYDFARHYDADAQLVVGTDYYPETGREVISYLRTSAVGVGTPRGVKVGDSEKALLTEYPEALYCIAADESELYDGYSDEGGYSEPAYDFDRAYVWQPQTPQDDGNYDVRDIAFYLKDGTVSAITMTKPYAFRFAYGVDRDAALRLAEENRSALCGQ